MTSPSCKSSFLFLRASCCCLFVQSWVFSFDNNSNKKSANSSVCIVTDSSWLLSVFVQLLNWTYKRWRNDSNWYLPNLFTSSMKSSWRAEQSSVLSSSSYPLQNSQVPRWQSLPGCWQTRHLKMSWSELYWSWMSKYFLQTILLWWGLYLLECQRWLLWRDLKTFHSLKNE